MVESTAAVAKLDELALLVGNTPLIAIECMYRGIRRTVFAKCEQMNWTGSIKDRMALQILRSGYSSGAIRSNSVIVEATSGNTGISFAALGRALGHSVKLFIPDWMSRERIQLIQSYGAEVVLVSSDEGGFLGSIQQCEELARAGADVFLPRQFSNKANVEAHRIGTGPEIWKQLEQNGLTPDAFVAGVGTGGTIMGVGGYLRSRRSNIALHPVEPAESPILSTGVHCGHHRIQGISDEFIPSIVDLEWLDAPVSISDGDAILMAQKLAGTLGLAVGISSGCNVLAALSVHEKMGPDAIVVTVLVDDNKKYLSTGLFGVERPGSYFISPEVCLTGLKVLSGSRE
jgi:cysteine synthase A